MIYKIIKTLISISLWVFFRKRVINHREHIPANGPLVILANHPSTMLDPFIIASIVNRPVYFLAKGAMFKNKFAAKIFKYFNMIPVYRKQDGDGDMHKNEQTFDKCFEHLEKNGVLLMFPEGISITERKLKPLKTGAARIALGAEARNNFILGVKILNIGLNYDNPHEFRKDIFVNIGMPLEVNAYSKLYLEESSGAVKVLTENITTQLTSLIVDVKEKDQEELTEAIHNMYKQTYQEEENIDKKDKLEDFNLFKNISNIVTYFAKNNTEKFRLMYSRIMTYLDTCKRLDIEEQQLNAIKSKKSLPKEMSLAIFRFIFGLPLFLYGFVHNYLVFVITPKITRMITTELEYKGPINMLIGMFLYIITYGVLGVFVFHITTSWTATFLYVLSLPFSGLFSHWYIKSALLMRDKWRMIKIFYKKSSLISKLIIEREEIIKDLSKAKEEYLRAALKTDIII